MENFKKIDRSPASVSAAIKAYRADCARVKAEAEKHCQRRCHIVGRGVEIIALDETGERNDDLGGPEYIMAKELTVKGLKETAEHWAKRYSPNKQGRRLAAIHLAGGFDIYESFGEYMQAQKGDWMDYDIYEDWAGQDIPLSLFGIAVEEPQEHCNFCDFQFDDEEQLRCRACGRKRGEKVEAAPQPDCFMCPAKAEYLIHGHNVCEACAIEIA